MSTQTATLTFDLTDPEARVEFNIACRARDVRAALNDFDNYLHDEIKHKNVELRDGAESIRARLYEIMSAACVIIHE